MSAKLSDLLQDRVSMNLTLGEVKPARLNEAVRRVHSKFPPVAVPEFEGLEERLTLFLERLTNKNWVGYKLSEASALARDFFGSDMTKDPRWGAVKEEFLAELESNRKSFIRGCFTGYLASFKERSRLTGQLANALRDLDEIALGPMSKFEKKFDALNPKGLSERIVGELLEEEQPYEKIREYGVSAPHVLALFDDVFVSLIERLEPSLENAELKATEQIKNWLKPNSNYKMATGYNLGIEAILKPYLKQDPADQLKKNILNFLIETYGDPRIVKSGWVSVDQKYIEIIHKWLTGESLKTFFKIISKFDGSHMWEPRRIYWEMIFDRGWIQDAWPILNDDGVRHLRELAAQDKNKNFLKYGTIKETYQDPTCYFTMKIGDLVVVEGSHSFAIRAFKAENRKATPLHKAVYKKSELVVAKQHIDERITHNGDWQKRINRYLQLNR